MTFNAGQRLTANALEAATSQLFAYKTADEPVTNNTTLQDDDHLVVSPVVNAIYTLDAMLMYSCAVNTADLKIQFSFPSNATLHWAAVGPHSLWPPAVATDLEVEWAAQYNQTTSPTSTNAYGAVSTIFAVHLKGLLITTGTSAGSMRLRWAQNTANASATVVRAGSWMKLERVA